MTATATIHTMDVQADNGVHVVYQMTRVESGAQWLTGVHQIAPQGVSDPTPGAVWTTAMLLTLGNTVLAPQYESRRIAGERDQWWGLFTAGVDIDNLTPEFNALGDLRRELLRRLLNLMRSDVQQDDKAVVAQRVLPYLGKYSNGQIASVINNQNWNAAKVGVVRGKLQALADSLVALDHGEPEIE